MVSDADGCRRRYPDIVMDKARRMEQLERERHVEDLGRDLAGSACRQEHHRGAHLLPQALLEMVESGAEQRIVMLQRGPKEFVETCQFPGDGSLYLL